MLLQAHCKHTVMSMGVVCCIGGAISCVLRIVWVMEVLCVFKGVDFKCLITLVLLISLTLILCLFENINFYLLVVLRWNVYTYLLVHGAI